MDLEDIILSKISQRKTNIIQFQSYVQSKKSNKQMKLLDTEVRWLSEEKAVERWAKQVKEVNFMVTNGNEIYCVITF